MRLTNSANRYATPPSGVSCKLIRLLFALASPRYRACQRVQIFANNCARQRCLRNGNDDDDNYVKRRPAS